MIAANRFSAVWQVAGVAAAALCCYLVSQSVAAERAGLARVDRQIAQSRDAIAKLTTEITTRSRLTQIESWNRQLALQAPRPAQYVRSGIQLASLYAHDAHPQLPLDPAIAPNQGPIQQAAYEAPKPEAAPVAAAAAVAKPAPAPPPAIVHAPPPKVAPTPVVKLEKPAIEQAAYHPAPKPLLPDALAAKPRHAKAAEPALAAPLLHAAAYVRPQASPLDGIAPAPLLSADIASLAKAEQRRAKPKKADE